MNVGHKEEEEEASTHLFVSTWMNEADDQVNELQWEKMTFV